jgi:hypothetical protein
MSKKSATLADPEYELRSSSSSYFRTARNIVDVRLFHL